MQGQVISACLKTDDWLAAAYKEVDTVAPNLRPLYHALADDLRQQVGKSPPCEVLKLLKAAVMERGGKTAAGWRFMQRLPEEGVYHLVHGARWVAGVDLLNWRLRATNVISRANAVPAEMILLRRMVQLYVQLQASIRTAEEIVHVSDLNNSIIPRFLYHGSGFIALVRAAFRESYRRRDDEERYALELNDVTQWFVSDPALRGLNVLDRSQRCAPWSWFVRQARAYSFCTILKVQARLDDPEWFSLLGKHATLRHMQWSSSIGPFFYGDRKVVPLTTLLELCKESIDMEHCAHMYLDHCRCGVSRLFSIRLQEESVATAELALRGGKWHLRQIRGVQNRHPEPADIYAAREAERRYNDAYGTQ